MIANRTTKTDRARWWTVVIFAAAMAWVESAVVYYLRTMIHRIEPYQAHPLPVVGGLGPVEMVRELATLIMLFTVGLLAGRTWRSRLGYSAIAFGVWDISYYVFLKAICDWPHSLFDWDILFLVPLPWWGPVLAPVSIALLLIVWGTLASRFEPVRASTTSVIATWGAAFMGCVLALGLFMVDTMRVADGGVDAIRNVLPNRFNWPLFLVALALMATPVLELCRRIVRSSQLEAAVRLPSPALSPEDQA